jgi:hypothetical protein
MAKVTVLFGTSPGHRVWLATTAEGLVASTVTWALHFFVWRCTASLVVGPWVGLGGSPLFLLYTLLFDLSLVSHARAMFSDPGSVPPMAQPPNTRAERDADHGADYDAEAGRQQRVEAGPQKFTATGRWCEACHAYKPCGCDGESGGGWRRGTKYDFKKTGRWCSECHAFKPRKASHSATTGRCVVKLDHWCPWVGNAVGILNHKHFILFCFYHCCGCVVGVVLVASWVSDCWSHGLLPERTRLALEAMDGLVRLSTGRQRLAQTEGQPHGRRSASRRGLETALGPASDSSGGVDGDGLTPAPTPLFFDAPFRGSRGPDGVLMREGACGGCGFTTLFWLVMVQVIFGLFTLYMVLGERLPVTFTGKATSNALTCVRAGWIGCASDLGARRDGATACVASP